MLDKQRTRSRKPSTSNSQHSKGAYHKSLKKSKQGVSRSVSESVRAKTPLLGLDAKFTSRYSSTSNIDMSERHEHIQDSLPVISIRAQMTKKLESFRSSSPGSSNGLDVETSDVNVGALGMQSDTSGLTLFNISHPFASHYSVQDSGLSVTHNSVPGPPAMEPISNRWSPRPQCDLKSPSNKLLSQPDPTVVSDSASVISDGELTEFFDENLLALDLWQSPIPPTSKTEGLSFDNASVDPFPNHGKQPISLDGLNTVTTSSYGSLMSSDQPQGCDNECITLDDEEELLLEDWEEAGPPSISPRAQASSDHDPPEMFAEEYADNILHTPIARPPFPAPVRDLLCIMGVSPSSYLRTCFRIGEALDEGCQAARRNKDVILELYAKVDSSW